MRAFQYLVLGASVISMFVIESCGTPKQIVTDETQRIVLQYSQPKKMPHYSGISYGLDIRIKSDLPDTPIIDNSEVYGFPVPGSYDIIPSPVDYVLTGLRSYASGAGFRIASSDGYRLFVRLKEFSIKNSMRTIGNVVLEYELLNSDGTPILSSTIVTGTHNVGLILNAERMSKVINSTLNNAFEQINWQAIADQLKVHDRPAAERQKQVKGDGDTALEQTVIRWYIVSSPAGADVSWRVVSSTPDVKNTNASYVGTTPYETTETFDIRGLKFDNSGNVQIEVTCEKPGYLPQKRRFNLRQAIEQREISAKFNLVKDE